MIRLSSVFWLLLVSATALTTFAVKYEVQALADQLTDAKKATASESREMRVLDAEWAYLNRPDMLAAMNQRFLSLVPITRKQLQTAIADIPMRPVPVPVPAAPQAPVPPAGPTPEIGPVAALDTWPSGTAPPAAPGSQDRPAVPEATDRPATPARLMMASAPVRALLARPTTAAPLARARSLDSRSLDQLIARIAGGR